MKLIEFVWSGYNFLNVRTVQGIAVKKLLFIKSVKKVLGAFLHPISIMWPLFLSLLLLLLIILPPHSSLARGKYGKITLEGPLEFELNAVLKATNNLHKSCLSMNDRQVDRSIKVLLSNLKRANEKSNLAKGQKHHLKKMLNVATSHLELTLNRSGEKRRESLKDAFNHLVQIAKVYKLDDYKIFFCPIDKAVWLQKSSKPANPVHPKKYGSCGKLVP